MTKCHVCQTEIAGIPPAQVRRPGHYESDAICAGCFEKRRIADDAMLVPIDLAELAEQVRASLLRLHGEHERLSEYPAATALMRPMRNQFIEMIQAVALLYNLSYACAEPSHECEHASNAQLTTLMLLELAFLAGAKAASQLTGGSWLGDGLLH